MNFKVVCLTFFLLSGFPLMSSCHASGSTLAAAPTATTTSAWQRFCHRVKELLPGSSRPVVVVPPIPTPVASPAAPALPVPLLSRLLVGKERMQRVDPILTKLEQTLQRANRVLELNQLRPVVKDLPQITSKTNRFLTQANNWLPIFALVAVPLFLLMGAYLVKTTFFTKSPAQELLEALKLSRRRPQGRPALSRKTLNPGVKVAAVEA